MSDEQPISRRDALVAATMLGVAASVSQVGGTEKKLVRVAGGLTFVGWDDVIPTTDDEVAIRELSKLANLLKLQITLEDGKVVEFNASKAVIKFRGSGTVVATADGIVPMRQPAER